ncbi:MAG: hypothetical protein ACWIPI_04615 [Polaribacter sp.]
MNSKNKYNYIAIDRDFKGKEGAAGYNRLSLWRINDYGLAKFYVDKTLEFIFENEYPTIRSWYSKNECNIEYPILITNDKRLYQVYRNVLSFEEFNLYCKGDKEKKFLIENHNNHPNINIYKGVLFQPFILDDYAGSAEKILQIIEELIKGNGLGAKNFDPGYTEYDNSTGEYYEFYNSDLLGVLELTNEAFFIENLSKEYRAK